jgi:hypothetical protein
MEILSNIDLRWFLPLVLWSIIWKGLALWRAARRREKGWFIVFMIINTVGLLEIIYYFLIAKTDKK